MSGLLDNEGFSGSVCGDLVRSSTGIDEGRAPEGEDGQKCKLEVLTLSLNLFIMSGFSRPKRLWGTPAGSWRGLTELGSSVEYPLLTTEFLSLAL
jgi:hypothetical protein